MNLDSTQIVVIHDGLISTNDPLLVELRIRFGEQNVEYFPSSNPGLEYVLANLSSKMVVLLDVNFSHGEKSGFQVFEEIRERTSLIYVIMITANDLNTLRTEDLITLVNHDAFAIESVASDYIKIISLVDKAAHQLEVRVASVLEQWINLRSPDEQATQFIMTSDGTKYTLGDLLGEIRQQSEIGMAVERNILVLAIDLLTRQKEKLNG